MKKSSVRDYAALAIVGMLAGGCVTPPQSAPRSKAVEKTTFSGQALVVYFFYAVQIDCSSAGLPKVWVTGAAAHGSVALKNVDHFTEYPATNQRFECNKKKNPSVEVVYTSDKNFVGVDRFTVKCLFPAGNVTTEEFLITVEKSPATEPTSG